MSDILKKAKQLTAQTEQGPSAAEVTVNVAVMEEAASHCPTCHRPPAYEVQVSNLPSDEVQVSNLAQGARAKPTLFHWDSLAQKYLLEKLKELGPGCELLLPAPFAMSVPTKLPSGKIILINKLGQEVQS